MKVLQIEPWIDEAEAEELLKVIRSTFITEHAATAEFEENFKTLTGAQHAIAVFNATVGLYTALKALGIGAGDEVLVPDLTFVATANAVIMAGATPVFCDVERNSFNIDPAVIEEKITPRTKAIMPVHLYGQSADMDRILEIARRHGLKVIEDAAESVGATFNGKYVGTLGDIGVFSFYANKIMTTAEGGLLLTESKELADQCMILKNHGRTEKGTFVHPHVGFNFKFTDLQAAVGNAQFKKLPKMMERKREILKWYREALADVPEVEFPWQDPRCSNVIWFINILTPTVPSLELQSHLEKGEVQTRPFFPPLHTQPCYGPELTQGNFPNATWLHAHGLSLPSGVGLTREQVNHVAEGIREFFKP